MRKELVAVLFLTILYTLSLVHSAQVVEVQNTNLPPPEEKKGLIASVWDFVTSPLVLGIFFLFIVMILIIVGLVFLIRWLIKYFKSRNDIFYKLNRDRIFMAKVHRRYNSKHWWRVTKNTPIRIVKEENGKPVISKPIGYHRGDYVSHEGNVIISMNLIGKKRWYVYPETELLVIPNRDKVKFYKKDESGNDVSVEMINIPHAKDIVQFTENDILLYLEGISKTGLFLIPVVKSKDGKIINLSFPVFQTLKDVVLHEYLYDQTADFAQLARQAMQINPFIRATQKITDNNSQVDIQPERI